MEELLRQPLDLRPEVVYAALAYFYDHFDELLSQMKANRASAESLQGPANSSRDELLSRRKDVDQVALRFDMDVRTPAAITEGLRRRGVNELTSQEDGTREITHEILPGRAMELDRVLFSQDTDFLRLAHEWQLRNTSRLLESCLRTNKD